jgi:DNA-binding response OmpR family regulator
MSHPKILYVEDEPFLAKIVRETLEGKGFVVKHVDEGLSAVEKFTSWNPDICVLDVMLPGKDGFTIGSEIRKLNATIPIIYLTAKDQTKDLVKGFSSGGNDYVKKPFSMEELIVRIENLLHLSDSRKQDLSDSTVFNLGRFEFNAIKMELVSPEINVQLSHRESEILKMLCRETNGQLNRKDILLEIWGDDSFFNSRNLDVYIRKIRKYLAADPSVQLITLKGIGYRLVTSN